MYLKIKLILLPILFISINLFGQTYSFSELIIRANVETSSGSEQRIIDTKRETFKFKFEKSTDGKPLFTLIKPGMNYSDSDYYVLVEDMGYVENNNKLFEKGHYYSTEDETGVIVLVARDKSIIVIFKPNIIEEYLK